MIFPVFRWNDDGGDGPLPASLRMIREHSAWLTRMLSGRGRRGRKPPRIPVRRVSDGGFSKLMATPAGRRKAEQWWLRTLEKVRD